MQEEKFREQLKPFESIREERVYDRKGKNESEVTIRGDSFRSFTFLPSETTKDKWCKNLLQHITNNVLINSSVDYYQGMSEISAYIVYFYFFDSVSKKFDEIEKQLTGSEIADESLEAIPGCSAHESTIDSNLEQYIDEKIFLQCSITIVNILDDKFIPLVHDNFKLYLQYNSIFLKFMKKRGVKIDDMISRKYMNNTLSWLTRSASNLDNIYRFIGIILQGPIFTPFLLLIKFFDEIENNSKIVKIPSDLEDELVKLQSEFEKVDEEEGGFSSNSVIAFLGVAGVVLAIVAYQLYRKEK